jgi:hypothetical protein
MAAIILATVCGLEIAMRQIASDDESARGMGGMVRDVGGLRTIPVSRNVRKLPGFHSERKS